MRDPPIISIPFASREERAFLRAIDPLAIALLREPPHRALPPDAPRGTYDNVRMTRYERVWRRLMDCAKAGYHPIHVRPKRGPRTIRYQLGSGLDWPRPYPADHPDCWYNQPPCDWTIFCRCPTCLWTLDAKYQKIDEHHAAKGLNYRGEPLRKSDIEFIVRGAAEDFTLWHDPAEELARAGVVSL